MAIFNWGCIGAGANANAMGEQLSMLQSVNLVAICQATTRRLDASKLYGFKKVVDNYKTLLSIPDIDIVYVGSANVDHAKHSLAALRAGKHVLCEKPVAMSMQELIEIQKTARSYGRLFLDGITQAYLPSFQTLTRQLKLRAPSLAIQLISKIDYNQMRRSATLTSPLLGGGVYENTGSYTAHMLVTLVGVNVVLSLHPERVVVSSVKGPDGVDWQTMVNLEFPSGTRATLTHVAYNTSTLSKVSSHSGVVTFDLDNLSQFTTEGVSIDMQSVGVGNRPGLAWEASHAMNLLTASKIQSPLLPHDVSRAILYLMDIVRSKIPTHPSYNNKNPTHPTHHTHHTHPTHYHHLNPVASKPEL